MQNHTNALTFNPLNLPRPLPSSLLLRPNLLPTSLTFSSTASACSIPIMSGLFSRLLGGSHNTHIALSPPPAASHGGYTPRDSGSSDRPAPALSPRRVAFATDVVDTSTPRLRAHDVRRSLANPAPTVMKHKDECIPTRHLTTACATKSDAEERPSQAQVPDAAQQRQILEIRRAHAVSAASYRTAHLLSTFVHKVNDSGHVQVALVVDGTTGMKTALRDLANYLPTVVTEFQRSYGTLWRFALVVYRNDRACVLQKSFVTAAEVVGQLQTMVPERPWLSDDDCFAGLTAAANELPWSASQRAIIWLGSRPQFVLHGFFSVAQVMAQVMVQNLIACHFLEVDHNATSGMIDDVKRAFSPVGAVLESYEEPDIWFSLWRALKAILHASVRCAVVRGPAINTSTVLEYTRWVSVALNTVRVTMDVPPGVHPLSNLMTRFPPSHEEQVPVRLEAAFAEGELCDAYRVTVDHPTFFATWRRTGEKVAKVARYAIPGWAQQRVHIRCVTTFLMREFSERLSQRDEQGTHQLMESVPAQLAEYSGHTFVVEPYVTGSFLKFNNNNGTTFRAATYPEPQAFSHFTHHYTGGRLIVVNLQGMKGIRCYTCTGAVIHTAARDKILPDSTNLGPAGMAAFYRTHQCNDVCRLLDLPDVPRDDDALEEFVEKLAREKRPIGACLADHSDVEYTMGM